MVSFPKEFGQAVAAERESACAWDKFENAFEALRILSRMKEKHPLFEAMWRGRVQKFREVSWQMSAKERRNAETQTVTKTTVAATQTETSTEKRRTLRDMLGDQRIEDEDEGGREKESLVRKQHKENTLLHHPQKKRKFRVPMTKASTPSNAAPQAAPGEAAASSVPERLKHCDPELVKRIEQEIMEKGERVTFDDVAGLQSAKDAITEMVVWPMKRPEFFTGLRAVPKGMLLFGPPGTGKTMIGRAIASSCEATFFSISASSLMSKWIGESEKMVRALFAVAGYREPSVVFVDEVDSLLSQRSSDENEASRRLKTEFLVQLEGVDSSKAAERVLVVGATNRPQELDEAARRRFVKRFHVPLPCDAARDVLFTRLLSKNSNDLTRTNVQDLVRRTQGFSGADVFNLCKEAAMGPMRDVGKSLFDEDGGGLDKIPPIAFRHFEKALRITRASVSPQDLVGYDEWDRLFGTVAT